MKKPHSQPGQTMQRVRVGMTGLASVLLLIALASAIFSSASHEAPVRAVGAPKADVVANLTNETAPSASASSEPLAELGVTPSTAAADGGQKTPGTTGN